MFGCFPVTIGVGYYLDGWFGSKQGPEQFWLDPTDEDVIKTGAAEFSFVTVIRPGTQPNITVHIREGWQQELYQVLGLRTQARSS